MNRDDKPIRRLPQDVRGMVTEEASDVGELHRVYALVVDIRKDFNGKLDDIGKQLANVNIYMARSETIEKERNLPARIGELTARIDASNTRIQLLEDTLKTQAAQSTGKRTIGDWAVKIVSFSGLILSIILAIKEIRGR